jgi:hypothetical protein
MTLYEHLSCWSKRNFKKGFSENEAGFVALNRNTDLPKEKEELQKLSVIKSLGTLK